MNGCLSDRSFNEGGEYLSEIGARIQVSLEHARHPHRYCSRPNKFRYHPLHRCYRCNTKWNQATDLSVRVVNLNLDDTCYHRGENAIIIIVKACTHTCNLPHSFRVEGSSFEFDLPNRTAYCEQQRMAAPGYHSLRLHRKLLVSMCLFVSFSKKLKLQLKACRICSFINFEVPTMQQAVKLMHQGS